MKTLSTYDHKYLKYLLLLLICSLTLSTTAQTIIPIQISKQGHLFVKVKVNGTEGNFIFDTGGGLTVLTKKFADKVKGISKQDGGFTGHRANGERLDLDLYTAKELSVGSFIEQQPTVSILDADFGEIDGLISLMTFKNQPFTIDLEHQQLILETIKSMSIRKQSAKTIALQLHADRDKSLDVFAYIKLDTLTLQFMLDSGAGNDVFRIHSKYMAALGIDKNDTTSVQTVYHKSETNANLQSAIYKAILRELHFKDAPSVSKTKFTGRFEDGLIYDGIMSINWIGKQLSFDLAKKKLFVK